MNIEILLLDAVSPIVLIIPLVLLLVSATIVAFGILWLIAYIRKRKSK